MAKPISLATPRRVKLPDVDWFRLKAAHGAIFEAEAVGRQRLATLSKEIQETVHGKQQAFDAVLKKLGKQYKFNAATVQWDEDTHEMIQDAREP